jgi:hypothetical protein
LSMESVSAAASASAMRDPSTVVRVYNAFADLPERYRALFEENSAYSFFLSRPWFENFCETALDPSEKTRIFAVEGVEASATPVAALVTRYLASPQRRFQPRTLSSLTNFYTSLYAPLLSSSQDLATSLEKLARGIRADSQAWDAVDLKWIDRDSPMFSGLQRAFRDAGMIVQTYFSAGNWYLPVNGRSYREYFQELRSSVRNIASSKNKKIERSGRARVDIVTGLTGLEEAIQAYEKIYASSWKVPEPYPHFIPGLIRICARHGWLRLGVVYIDGEPAAAQIWIVNGGTASIYKIAYDKRFADLSVGSFLTTRMMEHALDVDKVREVDYLTGDDKYKQDWMSHRRERWGILAMDPRTPRGALAIARHVGGRAIKRALVSLSSWIRPAQKDPRKA